MWVLPSLCGVIDKRMEGHDWSSHNGGKLPRGQPGAGVDTAYLRKEDFLWEKIEIAVSDGTAFVCMCVCTGGKGRGGDPEGGGEGLYNDVPTGARCFEAVCLPVQWILLGRYLYQKGAYGYGGERQDDEGSEAKLSLDLSPAGAPLPSLPPLEAAELQGRKVLGRQ